MQRLWRLSLHRRSSSFYKFPLSFPFISVSSSPPFHPPSEIPKSLELNSTQFNSIDLISIHEMKSSQIPPNKKTPSITIIILADSHITSLHRPRHLVVKITTTPGLIEGHLAVKVATTTDNSSSGAGAENRN